MIRIGMIVPANNAALEYDMYRMAPENMSFHSTRMPPAKGCEPEDAEAFRRQLLSAYRLLKRISMFVVYGRTYGTHKNIDIIKGVIGSKLIVPELAAKEFLNEFSLNSIWIGTPYIMERTVEESGYFERSGFNITGCGGLNKIFGLDISRTKSDEILKMLDKNRADIKNSSAIYIACTAMPSYNVLEKIHNEYNIPVISENSAILWKISKMANIKFKIPGI
ncbi:MAG: hypothetical protein QXZ44_06810 [Ferroplasma sp.]